MLKKNIAIYFTNILLSFSVNVKAQEIKSPEFIKEVANQLNRVRHTVKYCHSEDKMNDENLPDLIWNEKLTDAANFHATNMMKQNFFAHKDLESNNVGERAIKFGYKWRMIGENLAAGETKLPDVFRDWVASPGHCKNMINSSYTQFGFAQLKSDNPQNLYAYYWVLVLAK